MTDYQAQDAQFQERVRESFARQKVMALIGASLRTVQPGLVEIALPFHENLTQQHGYFHAGIVSTVADSACGYAALTLMPEGREVLSVEFKVNLLRPAAGDMLVARGQVLKPGRTLTVTRGDVHVLKDGREIFVATMQATMIAR